ncbi:MaoC/PaaZ C-terminal domain-containing protein [Streptomyces sp. NBC_00038]|uniref:MaoC/PaaZ C-terminal domain-containing protein n=1 Tax=Streptomyces sp. NBC_00038 TaxID=2903615 RepID=UPI002252A091|nr:MaoC/PaaZ C-terminal domain-containing protein [Streptomyces sp. NBC_00038]MCX5555753.1 MaoC/PaaZ C-terminal domain-containing protein [Streptomyces sp. NBC_00038]
MSGFSLAAAEVGAELPELLPEQIDRATLAAFAESYGDPNPIHLDPQAARAAGLDDVIAHGMLSMALLGRLLVEWAPVEDVLSFRASFTAVTTVPARLRCTARVKAIETVAGGRAARLALAVRRVDGPLTVRGEALVRIPAAPVSGARASSVRAPGVSAVASDPAAGSGFVPAAGSAPVTSAAVSVPAPASAPGTVPATIPGSVPGVPGVGPASVASAPALVPTPATVSVPAPAPAPVPAAMPADPAAGAAPVVPAPTPAPRPT